MIQKKKRAAGKKQWRAGLSLTAAALAVSLLWCGSFISFADTTGTVKVDSAKIREKADASSEAVGGAVQGTTVTITEETQDAAGTLWYKVDVNGTVGYIRSDLVEKGGSSESQTAQAPAQTEASASGASVDPAETVDAQYAQVSPDAIKVRTAPSVNEAIVDRLAQGTQVIISGQTEAGDGMKWYYVTFTGTDGAERTGYIRSDLLTMGDMVPVPEEETPQPEEVIPEEPEPEVPDEYELICISGADGSNEWYVCDNMGADGTKQYSLKELMKVTQMRSEEDAQAAKSLVRQRIVIVVMAVLLVLLIAAVVVLALKLRSVYYEEYEEEDDEEDEEEEEPAPRRRREREEEEEPAPRRRREREDEETSPRRRREREDEEASPRRRREREDEETSPRRRREREDEEASPRRRREREDEEAAPRRRRAEEREDDAQETAGTAPKRKTKNFLLDDDEFEFEFLNMDDKK